MPEIPREPEECNRFCAMQWQRTIAALGAALLSISAVSGCAPAAPGPSATSPGSSEPSATSPTGEQELPGVEVPLPELAPPISLADLGGFSGVARLEMGSNCTGTLIDTGVTDGPAYLITNGHCTGDVGRAAQQVTVGEEWFGKGFFLNTEDNPTPVVVNAEVLEYSTMRGRDVAIVRLEETLGYLRGLGLKPVPIIDAEPAAGTAVRNIAAPIQGLVDSEWVLRSGECNLEHQADLVELHWLWQGAWANKCPGVRQGSSGSPLFTVNADGTPAAIASVINTTTTGSSPANGGKCFLNRPCELTDGTPTWVEDMSYGVSVAGIGKCFNTAGEFALGGECPLEVSSVVAHQGGGIFRGGDLPDASHRLPVADLSLSGPVGTSAPVRTILAPLDRSDVCTDPATYANAVQATVSAVEHPWDPGLEVPANLPEEEGLFALCAVANDDYAGAATVIFQVDRTPPMFQPGASVEGIGEGNIVVNPFLNPPELTTVRFTWLPGDVECPATSEFQDFFVIPLMIEASDLPATYCIYGLDQAGNATDVVRMPLVSK